MISKVKLMISHLNKIGKYLIISVLLLNLVPAAFASASLTAALNSLCAMAKTFLGVAALVLIVLAGAVYAIGQIMGAETRARASVWATAMLTGAIIGAIIYVIAPIIVQLIIGSGVMTTTAC